MHNGIKVLDSHQHIWELDRGDYGWLTPEFGALYGSWTVDDVRGEADAAGVDEVVLVQAAGTLADTDYMLQAADSWDKVVGIVAWAPLVDPSGLAEALERYGSDKRIVGLRHQNHDEPDPYWLVRGDVLAGIASVQKAGLTLDVVATIPEHLEAVARLAADFPALPIVIDHLAKPDIKGGAWEPWAGLMAAAAAFPNVSAKFSGLDTTAEPNVYTAADIRPYLDHGLETFGADRLMFGSDWPLSVLAGGYTRWWSAVVELVAELSRDEQTAIFGGTGRSFYGIGRLTS